MVKWELIEAMPEFQAAAPEKQEKVRSFYQKWGQSHDWGGASAEAGKGQVISQPENMPADIMGGNAVTRLADTKSPIDQAEERWDTLMAKKARGEEPTPGEWAEAQTLGIPTYDPVDLVVDLSTAGMAGPMRQAGGKIGRALLNEAVEGMGAGLGMTALNNAGGGNLTQLAGGLVGATATGTGLTGARKALTALMKRGIPVEEAVQSVAKQLQLPPGEVRLLIEGPKTPEAPAISTRPVPMGTANQGTGMGTIDLPEKAPDMQAKALPEPGKPVSVITPADNTDIFAKLKAVDDDIQTTAQVARKLTKGKKGKARSNVLAQRMDYLKKQKTQLEQQIRENMEEVGIPEDRRLSDTRRMVPVTTQGGALVPSGPSPKVQDARLRAAGTQLEGRDRAIPMGGPQKAAIQDEPLRMYEEGENWHELDEGPTKLDMERKAEAQDLTLTGYDERAEAVKVIKANGGLNYETVKAGYGPSEGKALRSLARDHGLWKKDGRLGLDQAVELLNQHGITVEDQNHLADILSGKKRPAKAPKIEEPEFDPATEFDPQAWGWDMDAPKAKVVEAPKVEAPVEVPMTEAQRMDIIRGYLDRREKVPAELFEKDALNRKPASAYPQRAKKAESGAEVSPKLLREKERLETKLERLNAIEQHRRETDMPGVFVTGRSGISSSRSKKLDRQLDRSIDTAKEYVDTYKKLEMTKTQIEYQKKAPIRAKAKELLAVDEAKRFDSIEVGDKIDIGGNAPIRVIKKNRKTVVTDGGTKWKAGEIFAVHKPSPAPKAKAAEPSPEALYAIHPSMRKALGPEMDDWTKKTIEMEPLKEPLKDRLEKGVDDIITKLYRSEHPVIKLAGKAGGKPAKEAVYGQTSRMHGTGAKISEAVAGKHRADGGKSLKEIIKPLKSEQEAADYEAMRIAERTIALANRKGPKVSGLDPEGASDTLTRLRSRYSAADWTRLQAVSKEHRAFDRHVLDLMHDIGQVSDEAYAKMINAPEGESYASFMRAFDEDMDLAGIKDVASPGNPIKAIKGGEKKIQPTVVSSMMNVARAYKLREQMKLNNIVAGLADSSHGAIRKATLVGGQIPENSFYTFKNGEKEWWTVPSEVAQAMSVYAPHQVNAIAAVCAPVTRMLRTGATASLEFALGKNPIRDVQTSFIAQGTPPHRFLQGLSHTLKKRLTGADKLYDEWVKHGGGNANLVSLDRAKLHLVQKDIQSFRKLYDTHNLKTYANPLEWLRSISELFENTTRLGNYAHAKAKGLSPDKAAVKSRDSTLDFASFGDVMRDVNKIWAFSNAAMKDQEQLAKILFKGTAKEKAGVWLRAGMSMTLPTLALWAMQHDNKHYQELPSWRKNLFWNVVVGDKVLSLPKPFSLGVLFAGLPESMLNYYYEKDPDAMNDWARDFIGSLMPSAMPTPAGPAVENMTNHDFFTGGRVVSQAYEGLPDEMQASPRTSKTATVIGEALGYSPMKIDHLIRGYGAGLGTEATKLVDFLIGDERVKPAKNWYEKTPVIKGMVHDSPKGFQSASVRAFYTLWDDMDKKFRGTKKLAESGSPRTKAYARANRKALTQYAEAKIIYKALGQLNKARRAIQEKDDITPAKKRALLDKVENAMTTVTRKFLRGRYK